MKKIIYIVLGLLIFGIFAIKQSAGLWGSSQSVTTKPLKLKEGLKTAVLAGGCFWCIESDFEKISGVYEVISGYAGGHTVNPKYKQVSAGTSGHIEVVKIYYDPKVISYQGLIRKLWRASDPTDSDGQFSDRGNQYRPAIFYSNLDEKRIAEAEKQRINDSGKYDKMVTIDIIKLGKFYKAEEVHQNYYKKNPLRYKLYRRGSGRDRYLEKTWGNS